MTKGRIDKEWLSGCEPSHGDKRWAGKMMSILERLFPAGTAPDDLCALVDGKRVVLTKEWFVIARSKERRAPEELLRRVGRRTGADTFPGT